MTQLARFLLEHPPTLWWIVYPYALMSGASVWLPSARATVDRIRSGSR